MTDRPQLTIICYDVGSDRNRAKVAEFLETFAVRVQKSVFEARLTRPQRERTLSALEAWIGREDSIRFYVVPADAVGDCGLIGNGSPPTSGSHLLF